MEKKFVFNVDETSEIVSKALANVYYEKHKEDASFSIPADSLKVAVEAANLGGKLMEKKIAENAVTSRYMVLKALYDFDILCNENGAFKSVTTVQKNDVIIVSKIPDCGIDDNVEFISDDYMTVLKFALCMPVNFNVHKLQDLPNYIFARRKPEIKFTAKWYEFR
ncbi:MAG: hypothetical protein IKV76_03785 [Clostridia bacterium]|nr:hypothetical protein [Clostridia bacterium]